MTRRDFLRNTGLVAAQFAIVPTQLKASEPGPMEITIIRPADFCYLRVKLFGYYFHETGSRVISIRTLDGYAGARGIAVIFPSQHWAEEGVTDEQKKPDFPRLALAGDSQWFFSAPTIADLGAVGGSRLTLEAFLQYCADGPQVLAAPGQGATGQRTQLRIPNGLTLAPYAPGNENLTWLHRAIARPISVNGAKRRFELWHSTLALGPRSDTGAAPVSKERWSGTFNPDLLLKLLTEKAPTEAELGHGVLRPVAPPNILDDEEAKKPKDGWYSPDHDQRSKLVANLMVAAGETVRGTLQAKHLSLSAVGANASLLYALEAERAAVGNGLARMEHRITLGRDQFVEVVEVGYYLPNYHLAANVVVTDRTDADKPKGVARLRRRRFLLVLEDTRVAPPAGCLVERLDAVAAEWAKAGRNAGVRGWTFITRFCEYDKLGKCATGPRAPGKWGLTANENNDYGWPCRILPDGSLEPIALTVRPIDQRAPDLYPDRPDRVPEHFVRPCFVKVPIGHIGWKDGHADWNRAAKRFPQVPYLTGLHPRVADVREETDPAAKIETVSKLTLVPPVALGAAKLAELSVPDDLCQPAQKLIDQLASDFGDVTASWSKDSLRLLNERLQAVIKQVPRTWNTDERAKAGFLVQATLNEWLEGGLDGLDRLEASLGQLLRQGLSVAQSDAAATAARLRSILERLPMLRAKYQAVWFELEKPTTGVTADGYRRMVGELQLNLARDAAGLLRARAATVAEAWIYNETIEELKALAAKLPPSSAASWKAMLDAQMAEIFAAAPVRGATAKAWRAVWEVEAVVRGLEAVEGATDAITIAFRRQLSTMRTAVELWLGRIECTARLAEVRAAVEAAAANLTLDAQLKDALECCLSRGEATAEKMRWLHQQLRAADVVAILRALPFPLGTVERWVKRYEAAKELPVLDELWPGLPEAHLCVVRRILFDAIRDYRTLPALVDAADEIAVRFALMDRWAKQALEKAQAVSRELQALEAAVDDSVVAARQALAEQCRQAEQQFSLAQTAAAAQVNRAIEKVEDKVRASELAKKAKQVTDDAQRLAKELDAAVTAINNLDRNLKEARAEAERRIEQLKAETSAATTEARRNATDLAVEYLNFTVNDTVRQVLAPEWDRARVQLDELAGLGQEKLKTVLQPLEQYQKEGFARYDEAQKTLSGAALGAYAVFNEAVQQGREAVNAGLADMRIKYGGLAREVGVMMAETKEQVTQAAAATMSAYLPKDLLGDVRLLDVFPLAALIDEKREMVRNLPKALTRQFGGVRESSWSWEQPLNSPTAVPFVRFEHDGHTALRLKQTVRVAIADGTASTFTEGYMGPDFRLVLAEVVSITIKDVRFSYGSGRAMDLVPVIGAVEFGGSLQFLKALQGFLERFSAAADILAGLQSGMFWYGRSFALPDISFGGFSLSHLALNWSVGLPLKATDGLGLRYKFSFCSLRRPFQLMVSGYKGEGFFALTLSSAVGVQALEGSLGFGGGAEFDIGIAQGYASLVAAIYIKREVKGKNVSSSLIMGYVHGYGALTVLGFIHFSLDVMLAVAREQLGGQETIYGTASIEVTYKIGWIKQSVGFAYSHRFSGSGGGSESGGGNSYLPRRAAEFIANLESALAAAPRLASVAGGVGGTRTRQLPGSRQDSKNALHVFSTPEAFGTYWGYCTGK